MTLIAALIWFAVITIALIAFEITFTYGTRGFGYGFSSNRAKVDLSAFEGRMKRTLQNHAESAAHIVPVLAAGALLGVTGRGG